MIFDTCNKYYDIYKQLEQQQKDQLKRILYKKELLEEYFYQQFSNPEEIKTLHNELNYLEPKGQIKNICNIPEQQIIKTTFKNKDVFQDGVYSYGPIRQYLIETPDLVNQFKTWHKNKKVQHKLSQQDLDKFLMQEEEYIQTNQIIDCAPGAGKTTTILNQIRQLKHKQVQYLVFNRINKDEAEQKLKITKDSNIKVDTHCAFQQRLLSQNGYTLINSQQLLEYLDIKIKYAEEQKNLYKHHNLPTDNNTLYVLISYYLYDLFDIKCTKQIDFQCNQDQELNELVYEIMKETEKLIQKSLLFKIDEPIIKKNQKKATLELLAYQAYIAFYNLAINKFYTIESQQIALQQLVKKKNRNQKQQQIHLFLDECQDMSTLDFQALDFYLRQHNEYTIVAVGDMRQQINQFRGGHLNIFKFLTEFYEQRNLKYTINSQNKSYRVGEQIIKFIDELIPLDYRFQAASKHDSQATETKECTKTVIIKQLQQHLEEYKVNKSNQRFIKRIALLGMNNRQVMLFKKEVDSFIEDLRKQFPELQILLEPKLKKENFVYQPEKFLLKKACMTRTQTYSFFKQHENLLQQNKKQIQNNKPTIYIDISTVHKYKGLEANSVIFKSYQLNENADEQTILQHQNLEFVAYSRAINYLILLQKD